MALIKFTWFELMVNRDAVIKNETLTFPFTRYEALGRSNSPSTLEVIHLQSLARVNNLLIFRKRIPPVQNMVTFSVPWDLNRQTPTLEINKRLVSGLIAPLKVPIISTSITGINSYGF